LGIKARDFAFFRLVSINSDDLIDRSSQYCCQDDKVIDRWQAVAVLTAINRLRIGKSEDYLKLSYLDAYFFPHSSDILTCLFKIYCRDLAASQSCTHFFSSVKNRLSHI
jgi:hypothetical protein